MKAYRIVGGRWAPLIADDTTPPPPPPPTDARFYGDPGVGNVYYGSSWDGNNVDEWVTFSGQCGGLGVARRYYYDGEVTGGLGKNFTSEAARVKASGALMAASFKTPDNNWAAVANGNQDAWLDSIAQAAANHGDPVFICLHHEPFSKNDPRGGDGGTPADFRNMYKRAHSRWSSVPNLLTMPIYNGYPFVDDSQTSRDFYTPDCDVQGVDIYPRAMKNRAQTWAKYEKGLGNLSKMSGGMPMFLAEYGARVSIQGDYSAPMIRDIYDYCVSRGDVVGITYFNSGKNVNTADPTTYRLDGARLDVFKQCAALPTSVVPAELTY